MPLKHRKLGATGHAYAATGQGYSIRAAVESNGYRMKLQTTIQYEALTDRQIAHVHEMMAAAITQAVSTAAQMRHDNVPLFDLEAIAPQGKGAGINER